MQNPISTLHKIALIEGASFLVLLFVAMPAKYMFGVAKAVTVVGWLHGVLFVLFSFALLWAMLVARWSIGRAALIFIGGLVPFGPFLLHGRMSEYEAEYIGRGR